MHHAGRAGGKLVSTLHTGQMHETDNPYIAAEVRCRGGEVWV